MCALSVRDANFVVYSTCSIMVGTAEPWFGARSYVRNSMFPVHF